MVQAIVITTHNVHKSNHSSERILGERTGGKPKGDLNDRINREDLSTRKRRAKADIVGKIASKP
jgi:hypothetical protein